MANGLVEFDAEAEAENELEAAALLAEENTVVEVEVDDELGATQVDVEVVVGGGV